MACKHRSSWLIAGGYIEWCHGCGAFRNLSHMGGVSSALAVVSPWCRVGESHDVFQRRKEAYIKAQHTRARKRDKKAAS